MQINLSSLLSHFRVMVGPYGFYQHATGTEPLLSEGYCTDDNARAVQVLIRLGRLVAPVERLALEALLEPCWRFLCQAERPAGDYINFRTVQGEWLPAGVSDDMYARLIRALVTVLANEFQTQRHAKAGQMLISLMERRVPQLTVVRAWAEVLIALAALPPVWQEQLRVAEVEERLVEKLLHSWHEQHKPDWPWFEPAMTYANALLPHGLLCGQKVSAVADRQEVLHGSSSFLLATTVRGDMFMPVGNRGWYQRGAKQPALYDQQPIEAGTMFDFLVDYQSVYPERVTKETVVAPYLWFFGHNSRRAALADPERGTCFDGLHADRVNSNCGAESLLAYLWVEVRLRESSPEITDYAFKRREELLAEIKP